MQPSKPDTNGLGSLFEFRPSGSVLVTGAGGFVGSHLVQSLCEQWVAVRALQHTQPLDAACSRADVQRGNVLDASAVRAAMRDVSVVFHLAGVASVQAAETSPEFAFQVNTLGMQNVLEAARSAGVERVVTLSTAHVFGRPQALPVREDHPFRPLSIYAATKLAADVLAIGWYRSFGLPVNILRSFNIYGPRQRAGSVIPKIISQALAGGAVEMQDLRPRRDFLFVDDVVEALVRAAAAPVAGRELLLASGKAVSIGSLVRLVTALAAGQTANVPDESQGEGDCLFGAADRAREILGWEPRVSLAEGLARTIDWWRSEQPAEALSGRSS